MGPKGNKIFIVSVEIPLLAMRPPMFERDRWWNLVHTVLLDLLLKWGPNWSITDSKHFPARINCFKYAALSWFLLSGQRPNPSSYQMHTTLENRRLMGFRPFQLMLFCTAPTNRTHLNRPTRVTLGHAIWRVLFTFMKTWVMGGLRLYNSWFY